MKRIVSFFSFQDIVSFLLLFIVVMAVISLWSSFLGNKNIDNYLNSMYLKEKNEQHIIICSLKDVDKFNYSVKWCRNTFKFQVGEILEKKFFYSPEVIYIYNLKGINEYKGNFNTIYVLGWEKIPSEEIIDELNEMIAKNTNSVKYLDRVMEYVFK